jgi:hypothetical protein
MEERPMQPRTCIPSAFTLSVAVLFGLTAMAADLPKEGTFEVTYSAFSTVKESTLGEGQLVVAYDQNGLTAGNGILDHMTWHCIELVGIASGMVQWQSRCVGTDPAGDQIASEGLSDGKYAIDAKSYRGKGRFTTGTGKYSGIHGDWTFVGHSPEFRAEAEGTGVEFGPLQGRYKLP